MATIEERVVGMRFDSSKFQSGIKPALDGLDKLKASLKLDGATKAIDELDAAGKRFSLGSLAAATDGVGGKFIAMATIGITALSNIVNRAVDAGARIMKSLTVDPVKAGLDEYELKMGSIQTILANTARFNTGLPEVVESLEELNEYADKTIYNFGAMTKNIGLFTNAGIGVKDATSMIKGFSNEAAASGTNAEGAASAAYQLSQALSSGTIRLMDFKSLTNVGMGNKNMQNGLIEIADAMGTFSNGTATAESAGKNFNASLEENWLSADVMSAYLRIMAGDMDAATQASLGLTDAQIAGFAKQQKTAEEAATKVRTYTQLLGTLQESVGSGWAKSFDIIVGDFDDATELFTNVNNSLGGIIGEIGDSRNKLLQDFADLGGRDVAILAIKNAFQALLQIIRPIQRGLETIFPAMTGQNLLTIVQAVERFTKSLQINGTTSKNLERTSAGFFAILSIGAQIIGKIIGVLMDLVGVSTDGAEGILDFTGGIGDFLVSVDAALKSGTGLTRFFDKLSSVLVGAVSVIKVIAGVLWDFGVSLTQISKGGFDGFVERVEGRFTQLGSFFSGILDIVQAFGRGVKAVADFFQPFIARIGALAAGLGSAISDSFSNGNFNAILDFINTGLLAGIGVLIFTFVKKIKAFMDGAKPTGGLVDSIKSIFGELGNTLQAMQGQIKADMLLKIAAAVGILTLSVIALSMIDTGRLFIALGAVAIMFAELGAAMVAFDSQMSVKATAKLPVLAAGLIGLATAMLILSGAVAILSALSWEGLAKGLIGVGVALGIMTVAMMLMSKVGPGAILGSAALVIASAGLILLSGALLIFSTMSWDDIGRAMVLLGGSLAILAIGLTLMTGSIVGAASLVIAAAGLLIIAGALKVFATLSWDDIGRAMALLGSTLAILAVGLTLMMLALPGAAALVVAAAGLAVMAGVLKIFSTLSWEDIGQAMTLLGGTLVILAIGLTAMIAALPGAVALVVAAGALAVLAPVLLILGSMSWEQIWTGMGALALALTTLGVAGMLLIPAIPGLIGLGIALALVGIGVLAAGVGIAALAIGLTALAVGGGAAITVLVAAVSALAGLIPLIAQQIGLGFIEIINVIANNGAAITNGMVTVLTAVINALTILIPLGVNLIITFMMAIITAITTYIPFLADRGAAMIIGILSGLEKNIPQIAKKGTDVIIALMNGIAAEAPRLADAGAKAVIKLIDGLTRAINSNAGEMRAAGGRLALAIVDGMTGGMASGIGKLASSAANMAKSALNAAKAALGIKSPSREFKAVGKFSTEGLAVGLETYSGIATKAATNLGTNTVSALQKSMAKMGDMALSMDVNPTIRPVLDLSGIKKDAGLISGIVGDQTLAVDGATARAKEISSKYGEYQQAREGGDGPTTEVNMTQNNYSPKALPANELYRQNRNQMSILKGVLEKKDA